MHYYRFRPSGELAIKEFMYDEIYFSSATECNDPYDGKAFLTFEADYEMWRRLLEIAWSIFNNIDKPRWEEQLSAHIAELSPITYDAALELDYANALLSLSSPPDPLTAIALGEQVKSFLRLYKPKNTNFVSFSRVCTDILMWSHYASMHRGHCLIFKDIDGYLNQCPQRKKRTIVRKTRAGLAPSMSYGIPDSFAFQDITYSSDAVPNSAFSYFPQHVYGRAIEEQERIELAKRQSHQCLVKHNCWSYEQESRLILSPPPAWLFGETVEYSPQERLLNYLPNQLGGVIIGARMDVQQKMRFREIIQTRMERIARDPGDNVPVFSFVLFQAVLADDRRGVVIKPEEIFTLAKTLQKTDSDFERYLNEWQDGWAIVFNGSSGSTRRFL
ncbi:MAG: DUF2971 domain-containing protein [Desulfosporosinus sp.]|nr:DUF2971 domain-containing protein [Desulfosporosinus sp.]